MNILLVNNFDKSAYIYDMKTEKIFFVEGTEYKKFLKKDRESAWVYISISMVLVPIIRYFNFPPNNFLFLFCVIAAISFSIFLSYKIVGSIQQKTREISYKNTGMLLSNFHDNFDGKSNIKIIKQNIFWTRVIDAILIFLVCAIILLNAIVGIVNTDNLVLISIISFILYYRIVYVFPKRKSETLKKLLKIENSNNNQIANKVKKLFITTILLFSFFLLIAIIENKIFGANIPILLKYINLIYIIVSISYLIYQVVKVISSIFKKTKENKNDQ